MKLTDDDLQAISGLKSLKSLYLSRTPIGDEGLRHLSGLKQLESLDVGGTRVTAEGAKVLRRAIPKLMIDGV
jgi:Leucine-rich repeat (LRR) protein